MELFVIITLILCGITTLKYEIRKNQSTNILLTIFSENPIKKYKIHNIYSIKRKFDNSDNKHKIWVFGSNMVEAELLVSNKNSQITGRLGEGISKGTVEALWVYISHLIENGNLYEMNNNGETKKIKPAWKFRVRRN